MGWGRLRAPERERRDPNEVRRRRKRRRRKRRGGGGRDAGGGARERGLRLPGLGATRAGREGGAL